MAIDTWGSLYVGHCPPLAGLTTILEPAGKFTGAMIIKGMVCFNLVNIYQNVMGEFKNLRCNVLDLFNLQKKE